MRFAVFLPGQQVTLDTPYRPLHPHGLAAGCLQFRPRADSGVPLLRTPAAPFQGESRRVLRLGTLVSDRSIARSSCSEHSGPPFRDKALPCLATLGDRFIYQLSHSDTMDNIAAEILASIHKSEE